MAEKKTSIDPKVPTSIDVRVAQRIRAARQEAGISQATLGHALGVSFQQIQKYEWGVNRISADRLRIVSETVNRPISYFFSDAAALDPSDSDILSKLATMLTKADGRRLLGRLPTLNRRDLETVATVVEHLSSRTKNP